ncbi:MAG: serine protease, partial [Candidatus Competibacterales bacterium]|nr:serine protease [Candidatus Competibacterales bacterium]
MKGKLVSALALWAGLLTVSAVLGGPLTMPGERYRAPAPRSADGAQLRLRQPDLRAHNIRLPALSPAPRLQLESGRLRIGQGRALPALDSAGLSWTELADGGLVATLILESPQAAALRLQLSADSPLPEGVELKLFAPDAPDGEIIALQRRDLPPGRPYWSPTLTGARLGLELYLPPGVEPEALALSLPRLSHLALAPTALLDPRRLIDIGNAASCEIDVACDASGVPQLIIDSVAKILFSNGLGSSFACTGTLLNDTDPGSQIPYLLTANHCVGNEVEATSLEAYWFFQRASCSGPDPTSVTRTNGATLLSGGSDTDYSLLRLTQDPPNGVGLSGWSAQTVAPEAAVFGLHHPAGDLKKISRGSVQGLTLVNIIDFGLVSAIQTRWQSGVTEPGSSGSGLWRNSGG